MRHSLYECFELARSDIYTRSHGFFQSNRALEFFDQDNRLVDLYQFLSLRAGLEKFEYVGCGDNAIVIRYSEKQALRIRAPALEDRINTHHALSAPFICPIWKEVEIFGGRLNFVPFIPDLKNQTLRGFVNNEIAANFLIALIQAAFDHKPPIWFYDHFLAEFKFEQVGLLDDATPIIIDQGSAILEMDAPVDKKEKLESEKERWVDYKLGDLTPWDGRWHNEKGEAKIGSLELPAQRILEL